MGLAFSVVGVSMLVGTPIFGALLNTNASGPGAVLVWWRALVFAGVRPFSPVHPAHAHTSVQPTLPFHFHVRPPYAYAYYPATQLVFSLRRPKSLRDSFGLIWWATFRHGRCVGMHHGWVRVHGGLASVLRAAVTTRKHKFQF